jgi:hypothetical protein
MAKKTSKKAAKATTAPRAGRSATSRAKATTGDQASPDPDPAPTGEPGPPPGKGKITGHVLGLGDEGEADGATAPQTSGPRRRRKRTGRLTPPPDPAPTPENPDSPPPQLPAKKRGEILYRHKDGRVACAHHANIRNRSTYGTGWERIRKAERLRLLHKGEAPVCEGCAKMEAKKRAKVKPGLYWDQRGQIACELHIPYPGSDTWVFEHWKKIDRASAKEAKERGMELSCETCKVIAERKNATPPSTKKGRRKKKEAEPPAPKPKTKDLDPNLTLAQLSACYLEHLQAVGKSLATVFSYSMDLATSRKVLGADTKIAALTPERVAEYYRSPEVTLKRDGKPRTKVTVDKCRRVLRLALVWAEETGLIAKAPLPTTAEKE